MVLYFMFQMLTQAPMLILSFNMPKSQCSGCCKAQAGNICVATFDSTCSGSCRSIDPVVEVNVQCVAWKSLFGSSISRPFLNISRPFLNI
ncbi:hypothetical protein YC2023_087256 [Brassica napus]